MSSGLYEEASSARFPHRRVRDQHLQETEPESNDDTTRTARIFTLPFDDRNTDLRFRLRDEPDSLTTREFSRRYQFAGAFEVPDEEYALNRVWEAWNHGSGEESLLFTKTATASLSVADVVFLDEQAHVCLPIGWEAIDLEYEYLESYPPAEMLETLADMRAVDLIEYVEGGDQITFELDTSIPHVLAETMARHGYAFYEANTLSGSTLGITFVSPARMDGLLMTEGETREELPEAFHSEYAKMEAER